MRPRPRLAGVLAASVLAVAAAACSPGGADPLARAREHLARATKPCGDEPAVAGVAGVNAKPHLVFLGDWIVVAVCGLETVLDAADARPVNLFIEGRDTGNPPTGIDLETGTLTYVLDRDDDNKELWKPLLYDPLFEHTTTFRVSVGVAGERPLPRVPGADLTVELDKIYVDWSTILWLAFLAAVLVAFLLYARHSDILRDGPTLGGVRRPYSLARSQMAWWFLLIVLGYVYIWLVTGDRDTIAPSLLGLMGISAATALASVAISPRGADVGPRAQLLDEEIAAVEAARLRVAVELDKATATAEATPAPSWAPALRDALQRSQDDLEAKHARLVAERAGLTGFLPSAGWWRDVVRDDRGAVALDRFQIVVWTLVLGGVFVNGVVWELTMPEFNATLLALMGISSGTYIGFKIPATRGESRGAG